MLLICAMSQFIIELAAHRGTEGTCPQGYAQKMWTTEFGLSKANSVCDWDILKKATFRQPIKAGSPFLIHKQKKGPNLSERPHTKHTLGSF